MIGTVMYTFISATITYYIIKFTIYIYTLYNDGTLQSINTIPTLVKPGKYRWLLGDILGLKQAQNKAYIFFHNNSRTIGELKNYCMWILWNPVVILENVDDMNYMFNKGGNQFTKSYTYHKYYGWWLGNSILLAEGNEHSQQRKVFNGAFHFEAVQSMSDVLITKTNILVDILKQHNNQSIELNQHYSNLTQDVLGKLGFDYEFNCQTNTNNTFRNDLLACLRACKAKQYGLFPWSFRDDLRKGQEAYERLSKIINNVIATRERTGIPDNAKDILAQAMKARDNNARMTDAQLNANMHIFLFAGSDTTSAWLTCVTYYLSIYPRIQQKLQAELDHVDVYITDVMKLPYLQAVLRESLRVTPSGPTIGKQLRSDIKSITLPSGFKSTNNEIYICDIYSIHHSKQLWGDDADTYRPERWLNANSELTDKPHADHRYNLSQVYLPFVSGTRNCIGQNLARLEASIVAAVVFKTFSFKLKSDFEFRIEQEGTIMFPVGLEVLPTVRTP